MRQLWGTLWYDLPGWFFTFIYTEIIIFFVMVLTFVVKYIMPYDRYKKVSLIVNF